MYPPILLHCTTTLRNPRKNASPSFFSVGISHFLSHNLFPNGQLWMKKKSLKIMIFCNTDEETIKL